MRVDEHGVEYKYPCPCCGSEDMLDAEGMSTPCLTCGWIDDRQQRENRDSNGENWMSLNRARENYADHRSIWSEKDKKACIDHRKKYGFSTDDIEAVDCGEADKTGQLSSANRERVF